MKDEKVIRSIYLRRSLLKKAERRAKAENRSLNNWLDNQLEQILSPESRKSA